MVDRDRLYFLTMREAGQLMRSGQLSPVELLRACLDRIEATEDKLHSFVTLMADEAMEQARTAESEMLRGNYRGRCMASHSRSRTCTTRRAPALPPGPTSTWTACRPSMPSPPRASRTPAACWWQAGHARFALGGPTGPRPSSRPAPVDLDHITGGSSSGTGSSVASGQVMGGLGSCTGGSIRGPASYCGIVGLKPTYGGSAGGVVTLSWSQDHAGPMTWTVEDTAYMMQAIAGHDPKDPTSSTAPVPDYSASLVEDIRGMTFGMPRHYFFDPDPSVNPESVAVVEKAISELESLGANIREVSLPSLDYVRAANSVIMVSEAYAYHEPNLKRSPKSLAT